MRTWLLLLLLVAPAVAEPHAPIRIVSDRDFLSPSSGVSSGSGTAEDPYIIEGWDIAPGLLDLADPDAALHIEATDAHVLIRDITINVPFVAGIRVLEAANVTFQDVQMANQRQAFWADEVRDVRVERLQSMSAGRDAFNVLVTDSHRVVLRGLQLEGEGPGLQINGGRFLRVEGVQIQGHDSGARIQGASDVAITGLTAQDNQGDAIWLRNLTRLDARSVDALRSEADRGANSGRGIVAWNVIGSLHDVHVRGNDGVGLFLLDSQLPITSGQALDNAIGVYQEGVRGDVRDFEAHGNRKEGILVIGSGGSWLGQALRLHDNGATGLHVEGMGRVDLSDVRSEANRMGVVVHDTNLTIAGMYVANNDVGLGVLHAAGHIQRVQAAQNDIGIQVFDARGLTLEGNEAHGNGGDGFDLHGDLSVRDNAASGNGGYGIRVRDGSNATLTGNVVDSNGLGGLSGEIQQESPGPWILPVLLLAMALRVLHQRP